MVGMFGWQPFAHHLVLGMKILDHMTYSGADGQNSTVMSHFRRVTSVLLTGNSHTTTTTITTTTIRYMNLESFTINSETGSGRESMSPKHS